MAQNRFRFIGNEEIQGPFLPEGMMGMSPLQNVVMDRGVDGMATIRGPMQNPGRPDVMFPTNNPISQMEPEMIGDIQGPDYMPGTELPSRSQMLFDRAKIFSGDVGRALGPIGAMLRQRGGEFLDDAMLYGRTKLLENEIRNRPNYPNMSLRGTSTPEPTFPSSVTNPAMAPVDPFARLRTVPNEVPLIDRFKASANEKAMDAADILGRSVRAAGRGAVKGAQGAGRFGGNLLNAFLFGASSPNSLGENINQRFGSEGNIRQSIFGKKQTPAKPNIGPTKDGIKELKPKSSFKSAFAAARKAGKKEFNYKGKRYNTRLK